ncbi:MAG TPA: hypothetical protein VFQ85_12835 [Mycobacteriales bacterium]|jgi:hypothetical protein|nr:hypothetical protein [Mycobacteriales bacterium]
MWKPWAPRLGKTELAEALWPKLDRKITSSTPLPPIAEVIDEAVHLAYELRLIRGMAVEPDSS